MTKRVHEVALGINHLLYATLDYFDGTCETRTCITVQDCFSSDSVSSSFKQRVFLSMQTETCQQRRSSNQTLITSIAASFIAIGQVSRCSIITCGYDSILVHYHSAYSTFHTIGSQCSQVRQPHEVRVPRWSQPRAVEQVELRKLAWHTILWWSLKC